MYSLITIVITACSAYVSKTPYAALMLLTLRAQHGFENPDFEHPGFGNVTSLLLTQPVAPKKDEVLEQLVVKLHEQGFDEKALLA